MQNNSKIGGILSIVSGALGILGSVVMIALVFLFGFLANSPEFGLNTEEEDVFTFITVTYGIMGVGGLLLSILEIVGGVYALKTKMWGLALAGAIAGIFTFFPTGVAATIFMAMAHKEFSTHSLPNVATTGLQPQQ